MEDLLLFVNGTLMRGLELHGNLDGAEFVGEVSTAPLYRLYSIRDQHPGMFKDEKCGVAVQGELYRVGEDVRARVESREPADLYVGKVVLQDGREVLGILYPRRKAEEHHRDISEYGSWRNYIERSHAGKERE